MDSIKREIAIMKKVKHPNVLRLYEVMDDPKVLPVSRMLNHTRRRFSATEEQISVHLQKKRVGNAVVCPVCVAVFVFLHTLHRPSYSPLFGRGTRQI